jgi:t-SNARE complex subunit (syntaxin)
MALMVEPVKRDEAAEAAARRRRRSIALGLALAAFVIVVYVLTIVKMGPAVLDRPL